MIKWEYDQYIGDSVKTRTVGILKDFGRKGWELVSAVSIDDSIVVYVFKRPIEQIQKDLT